MKVSNKKNLYVADEDLQWFEKFKELFPDVSVSKVLAETLKYKCLLKEAELKGMVEYKVFRGKHDFSDDIFIGQEFRFDGLLLASGEDSHGVHLDVYVTKKGKFLVDSIYISEGTEYYDFKVYESYADLSQQIPNTLLMACAEYLSINSTVRTYEKLDI